MELCYRVPKELYIDLLADMIRANERRPLKVFVALLMTVGQLMVVIWLCISRLESDQKIFFLVWSLLLAGLTILRRCTVKQRAKGTLQRLEGSQLPMDYWEEHHLRTIGHELHLSYGDQKLTCPLYGITRIDEKSEALYLYCQNTIFDIIPATAFQDQAAMGKCAATIREMAICESNGSEEDMLQKVVPSGGVSWEMEEQDFENGQYLAFRTLYYRYRFLRKATFIRLAVSVAAVIHLMNHRSAVNVAVSVLILLLANLENISMLPVVSRMRIRREVGNWKGSREYNLALHEDTMIYTSERAGVSIPINKINLCEEIGAYFVVAWNNFPAVIIPRQKLQEPEIEEVIQKIKTQYQISHTLRQKGPTL